MIDTIKEVDVELMIAELGCFSEYSSLNLNSKSPDELKKIFNEHCEKYSEEIPIIDIWNKFQNVSFLTSTPDGYQGVGDFYKKKERSIHYIKTSNGNKAKISQDHLFETSKGWIKTENIKKGDLILTENGFFNVVSNEVICVEEVYDWEILHENHRYWVDGLSSHNSGKSFLCLNIVREAQKMGYNVIYCDTEGAIDKEGAIKFGIDPKLIRYQPIQTVSEFKHFVMKVCEMVKESNAKIMIVLDSLGMLGTDKEMNDAKEGHNAGDMGLKAKELRSLFRTITFELTSAKIPLLCTNHVYTGGGYIQTKEASGGMGGIFSTSIISFLSKAQLKEGDTKTGIIVTSKLKKSRFTIPRDIKFHISFLGGMNKYVGLEDYISWDNCGVQRGYLYTSKEYSKLKDADKTSKDAEFTVDRVNTETGEVTQENMWFSPSETARTYVVRSSGETVPLSQLFTGKVFTQQVLKDLDENVIKKEFMLPTLANEDDEAAMIIDELESTEE